MIKDIELLRIRRKDDNYYELFHYGTVNIKKDMMFNSFIGYRTEHCYDYTLNFPLKNQRLTYEKTTSRVNIRFTVQENKPEEYYARLNWYQKLEICYSFKRLWIQKTANIMWLISLFVAFIASASAFYKCSHSAQDELKSPTEQTAGQAV